MKYLGEWEFNLLLQGCNDKRLMINISNDLLSTAVQWAEKWELGIGGGYKLIPSSDGFQSRFQFGLTATKDGQLISETQAEDLLQHIMSFAASVKMAISGNWREFTERDDIDQ